MTPEEIVLAAARAELKAEVTSGDVRAFLEYLANAGFVVAPREPTQEMQNAGWMVRKDISNTTSEIYIAMLSAYEEKAK